MARSWRSAARSALSRVMSCRAPARLAAAPLAAYKVRGTVKDLDTAARTFRIGGALFSYTGAQPLLAPEAGVKLQ